MRRFLCAAVALASLSQAFAAQADKDDGSYRMMLAAGVGRFTGDYGEEEKTTLDVLSLNARWYLDRAEIQVSLPYLRLDGAADISFVDGQPVAVGGDGAPDDQRRESGLGDIVLRGEYYLRTGTSTSPWIIGVLRVKLPTGNEARGLGSGATDIEGGISLVQRHGPISWLADASYILVGNTGDLDASNELRLGVGASVPIGSKQRSSAYVYFENRTNRFDGPDRRSIAVGASTALGAAKRTRLSASTFFGLSDSSEDVGVYITAGYRF